MSAHRTADIPLRSADVPGMLAAAFDLATAGSGRLAPAHLSRADVAIVAEHIGAADFERLPDGGFRFQCPACDVWDFGPTMPLEQAVRVWLHGGRLPPAALLAGACLTCEHATQPQGRDLPVEE
ncbi:hypothetical protein [Streptomyces sp. S1D4-20]|uniref:hypothetical protein n=1 Tax=Streptomyces sp. S1D4-20 TaxID=2594462 RepID=UPI001164D886|nr:hypothetical protein [Streptomyces sp. S1D4-20]QDN54217.1 hypothetical protein FNV67_01210 [Streptomyces sp. S1D4-20]